MKVTVNQLASLLKMAVGDAQKLIAVCHLRKRGDVRIQIREGEQKLAPTSIDTADLLEYRGIDLEPLVRNVQKNYLKSPATRRFILQVYPLGQIEKAEGKYCKLRIPPFLECLLTQEQKEEIWQYWHDTYASKAKNIFISKAEKEEADA